MDLDEVESAGVHIHDRLTDAPRSPGGGGGGNTSWACRLLRRGWNLTRKAAIAGAAATAAPVVAPPLIVLSAAGVALSVPFAAYLASLAATNYLTVALLRGCQPPSQPYHHEEYDDGVEQEFLDASEEYGQDAPAFAHFNTETEQAEEDETETSLLLPRGHGVSEASSAADAEEKEVEGEFSVQESGQDSFTSSRGDDSEEHTPVEKMELLPRKLFSDEDSQVQGMGEGGFFVLDPGQQSFQSENCSEQEGDVYSKCKEEDDRTTEENKSTKETLSQGFYLPELRVPVSADKGNVDQEKGEGELSEHNSGQYSLLPNPWNENEQEITMEERKSAEDMPPRDFVASESPAPLFHGEEKESDTSLLLPQDHGVSEALVPAFADEVRGDFSSVQESGLESYTSNGDEETEEHTPMGGRESIGNEVLPGGIGISSSAKPLFSDKDNLVQEKGEGGFSVHNSGQKSFQSKNWDKEEEDGKSTHENKSTNETLSQGLSFSEPHVPSRGGDDDYVVQEMGGVFFVQNLGQQSFQSKNWNEKQEEDGRTTEENKSTEETVSQGFYLPESRVPASGDKGNVDWQKGEGEFSAHNLSPYTLPSNTRDEKEQDITMEEKKSTEDMPPLDFVVSESSVPVFPGVDDVVQSKEGFEFTVQGVLEESSSNTDLDMGEVDNVQVDIIAIAAPESEVLPPSNHAARELPDLVTGEIVNVYAGIAVAAEPEPESDVLHPSNLTTRESLADPDTREIVDVQVDIVAAAAPESEVLPPLSSLAALESQAVVETAHVIEVKNEKGVAIEEKKSTEDKPPRESVVSEVLGAEYDVAQSKEGFEVAVQKLMEEANSKTDLVMGEVDDEQVEIIAIAASESEVLPLSNVVARESPADPVTGEVVDVQVETVAAAAPRSEVLHPSDLANTDTPAGPVTGEIVDVQIDVVAAAVPGSEVLPLSNLAALESQAVAETAHVSEIKNEKGMTIEEKKSTKDMQLGDSVVSESSVPVLGGQDDVAQSKEGFEVAVREVTEEANSNTDLVMGKVADVQLDISATAATESEVLPLTNVVARESPSDPVTGEVVNVQVDIVAAAAPRSELLHPSDLVTSDTRAEPVTGEIVDVQINVVAAAAPGSEVLPLSSIAACDSQAAAEIAHVGDIIGITVTEDIVMDFDDVNKGVSFAPVAMVHDGEDVMSSGSTPYLSTVEEEMIDQPNQSIGAGYGVMNEAFGSRVVAGGEADYTEEQLREQLDTIRTITGYGAVPSSTLEGELAGLYIFVGVEVEPAAGSGDASDRLMELNAKLRFLKSIIGVD